MPCTTPAGMSDECMAGKEGAEALLLHLPWLDSSDGACSSLQGCAKAAAYIKSFHAPRAVWAVCGGSTRLHSGHQGRLHDAGIMHHDACCIYIYIYINPKINKYMAAGSQTSGICTVIHITVLSRASLLEARTYILRCTTPDGLATMHA
jgi:hypothetical protein